MKYLLIGSLEIPMEERKQINMTKYEKLYNGIMDMLDWAEDQEHISEDAMEILKENLKRFKEELDKE